MPQSLMIGNHTAPAPIKRQRSTESREALVRPTSAATKPAGSGLLRANVKIPSYLDKGKAEISTTFQDLEWKQRFRLFHALENPQTSPWRVDRSDAVISRNRYGNVQPWDQSRIKLATPIANSDYVNASPIVLRSRASPTSDRPSQVDGDTIYNETRYIASQGPKDGQFIAFWHMVMQVTPGDVGVIIMLTPCFEANREKCSQYFPASATNPVMDLQHDDYWGAGPDAGFSHTDQDTSVSHPVQVKLTSMKHDTSTGCDVRTLDLTIDGTTKTIHHYLFNGWPDFGRPEAEDRAALLRLARESKVIAGDSPRIVHCSAGVGRTGTFVALDFLAREIEEGRFLDITAYPPIQSPTYFPNSNDENKDPNVSNGGQGAARTKPEQLKVMTPTTEEFEDGNSLKEDLIYSTVNALREQRMMMVMTEQQFAFLYEAIKEVFWENYRAGPEGAMIKGSESTDTDRPRGKIVRVEGGNGSEDGGSASEAETEIMDSGSHDARQQRGDGEEHGPAEDPYAIVAPDHIRGHTDHEAR